MERINLDELAGVVRVRAWATGAPASWKYAEVAVGTIPAEGYPDGVRWWASRAGQRWSGAWLADDERQACEAADSWMRRRGGEWRPTPARFDGSGNPTEGEWHRSGGTWLPGKPPVEA